MDRDIIDLVFHKVYGYYPGANERVQLCKNPPLFHPKITGPEYRAIRAIGRSWTSERRTTGLRNFWTELDKELEEYPQPKIDSED